MASGSGFVRKVTENHTTVLIPTVTSITVASIRGSPAWKREGTVFSAINDTTNEVTMALISDHALIRHQYQRRISTSPVPAPRARSSVHAPSTDLRLSETMIDARNRKTVAQRDTVT